MKINLSSRANYISYIIVPILIGLIFGFIFLSGTSLQKKWQVTILLVLFLLPLLAMSREKIGSVLFFGFVFSLSIEIGNSYFYDPSRGINYEIAINVPIVLFFLFAVLWGLEKVLRKEKIYIFKSTTIPALIFIILSSLSMLKSVDIYLSLFELIRMTTCFVIYFVTANYISSKKFSTKYLLFAILASLVLQCGFAISQYLREGSLGLEFFGEMEMNSQQWAPEPISRVGALMGHPNAFASFLLMSLPFPLLLSLISRSKMQRLFGGSIFILGIISMIMSYSRSAWAALGIGMVFIIGSLFYNKKINLKLIISPLVLFISIFSIVIYIFSEPIEKRIISDDYGSAKSRIPMMIDAVELIKHNPLLGVGLNNYPQVVSKYDVTGIHREWRNTVVHNLFLLIAGESGIFALILFLILLFLILFKIDLSSDFKNDKMIEILFFGAKFGLLLFLLFSLTDPAYRFYPGLQRTFWFLMGLINGLGKSG